VDPDCSVVLTYGSPESVTLAYDSGSESINIISGAWTDWDTFLSNSDCCPIITSCSLFEQGCLNAMSSPVSMESSSPWVINAENDWDAGYDQTLCVTCTNGVQTIQVDNWSVIQTPDCGTALTVPSNDPSVEILTFTNNEDSSLN
jgi:hypothetical protein